jgi:dTDP-4-dehydrorhamnose 3,5-epimerase-like enzyme
MITSIEEYNQRLKDIENNSDFNIKKIINPSSEEIFEIDLNTRIITVPEMFRNGTVEYDHNAETLYFKIDRYFDDEDLYTKTFVMQFKNSKNQG